METGMSGNSKSHSRTPLVGSSSQTSSDSDDKAGAPLL